MKVLIAIDQSNNWQQVMKSVAERHWPAGTQFEILTVFHDFEWNNIHTKDWDESTKEISEARKLVAEEILSKAKSLLSSCLPKAHVEVRLENGDAVWHILHEARMWAADKVIAGADHHSPNGAFGRVPRELIANSPCPVELVMLDTVCQAQQAS